MKNATPRKPNIHAPKAVYEAQVATLTPNAFVVIEFTKQGPKNLGTFGTEAKARETYDALAHGYLAAQFQYDLAQGAAGGQNTVWGLHK